MSPQGESLNQSLLQELSGNYDQLILICGHYEGVDERIVESEVDEEISIGDYVLTNGCLPAIVLVDAIGRFVPGGAACQLQRVQNGKAALQEDPQRAVLPGNGRLLDDGPEHGHGKLEPVS